MSTRRRAQPKKEHDIASALLEMSAKIGQQAREPNILAYRPHAKQEYFHRSDDYRTLYIGGNRSGKSFGAVAEDIWVASGTHPYKKTPPPPIRGRVVAVDLLQGVQGIILPLFQRLMAPSMMINGSWEDSYSPSDRILTFSNRSFIEFMSYEMKTDKFAGTSRHFIHYDEEPPRHVYEECQARLVDTKGRCWISMTPVEGMTWLYDKIYKPTHNDPDRQTLKQGSDYVGSVYRSLKTKTTVVEVSMGENPYLDKEAQENYLEELDEDQREARQTGSFVQLKGKVFQGFSKEAHVVPRIGNPAQEFKGWELYSSVDHGWANPTAWLWHAVAPNGTVITFGEHYQSQMTIGEHAQIVHEKERAWGIAVDNRAGDPAMKQTSAITGTSVQQEYAEHELYLALDSIPRDVGTGLARMQQYFRVPEGGKPRWFITEDCVNFIAEMENLHFQRWVSKKDQYEKNKKEEVNKKNDHAFDSARYFATMLPDLAPIAAESSNNGPERKVGMRYDEALALAEANRIDETVWTVLETY